MIIWKHIIKNIFEKPLRTLLLVACIACCAFVAVLGMDFLGNLDTILRNTFSQSVGNADFIVSNAIGTDRDYPLTVGNEQVRIYSTQGGILSFAEGEYEIFHKEPFEILNLDYEVARKWNLIMADPGADDTTCAVSKTFVKKTGFKEGDTVTLYDEEGKALKLKIGEVLPNYGIANGRSAVFVSREVMDRIAPGVKAYESFIKLDAAPGDVKAFEKAAREIEDADFNVKVQDSYHDETLAEAKSQLRMMFLMIFAIVFLLVIFVTYSVTGRIVSERMSSVGTLRSLGISRGKTAGILLLENALYGLIASLLGIMLYLPLRDGIMSTFITADFGDDFQIRMDYGTTPLYAYAATILLMVLIMVLCPLKEILITSRTSIRDIIFDNKDTEYRMTKTALILGSSAGVIALFTFFFQNYPAAQLLCFATLILAGSSLFPILLGWIAGRLGRSFSGAGAPLLSLAAAQAHTKKSTVGNAILCIASATLSVILVLFAGSSGDSLLIKAYTSDVHFYVGNNEGPERFSYIKDLEGVREVEFLYVKQESILIDGKKALLMKVFGEPEEGFRMLAGIKGLPETLQDDEVLMDRKVAEKYGVKPGDQVEITFGEESFLPITKTLTLSGTVDAYQHDQIGETIIVSKDTYIDMYHDRPGEVNVRCDNPERTADAIRKYSGSFADTVQLTEEINKEMQRSAEQANGMLKMIIGFGIALTLIGMISSQLIGFEGRKREFAVLASTSMSRGRIKGMLLLENLISMGIAVIVALPLALLAFWLLKRFLLCLGMRMAEGVPMAKVIALLAFMLVIYVSSAVVPMRHLRKMNLAEQLKYE